MAEQDDERDDRAAILARRQRFIAFALSGLATTACTDGGKPSDQDSTDSKDSKDAKDSKPRVSPRACLLKLIGEDPLGDPEPPPEPPQPPPEPPPQPCLKVAQPDPEDEGQPAPQPCLSKPRPCLRKAPPQPCLMQLPSDE